MHSISNLHLLRREQFRLTHEELLANRPLFLLLHFWLFLGLHLLKEAVHDPLESYWNLISGFLNHRFLLFGILFLLLHKLMTVEFLEFYLAQVFLYIHAGFHLDIVT